MHITFYMGTTRVSVVEIEDNQRAWKFAQWWVNTMAHSDGVEGPKVWENPNGRLSYRRGIYRALQTIRSPNKS